MQNEINTSLKQLDDFLNRLLTIPNMSFFFVGGLIRDILLNKRTHDIDIAFLGNFDKLSSLLSEKYSLQISKLNTIQIEMDDYHIDLAQMRKESYPFNDGVPVISPGSIEDDIARRDFTVNTAYAAFSHDNCTAVLNFLSYKRIKPLEIAYAHDHFLRDFNNRVIACLHPASFKEDPTRLLRAVKYNVQHHMHLDKKTKRIYWEAIHNNFIKNVSHTRFMMTLLKLIHCKDWEAIINQLVNDGIFKAYYDRTFLNIDKRRIAYMQSVEENELYWFRLLIIYNGQLELIEPLYPKKIQVLMKAMTQFKTLLQENSISEQLIQYYGDALLAYESQRRLAVYKIFRSFPSSEVMAFFGSLNAEDENQSYFLEWLLTLDSGIIDRVLITGADLIKLNVRISDINFWKDITTAIQINAMFSEHKTYQKKELLNMICDLAGLRQA